jgi:hypothetical protein
MKIILAYLLSFFMLFEKASPQTDTINELKLGDPLIGYIKLDNGYNFYKLTIPSGIQSNTNNLVIRVKETPNSERGENFSDPDIYVSQVIYILIQSYTDDKLPKNSRLFHMVFRKIRRRHNGHTKLLRKRGRNILHLSILPRKM